MRCWKQKKYYESKFNATNSCVWAKRWKRRDVWWCQPASSQKVVCSARKPVVKRNCQIYEDWKEKNPKERSGNTNREPVSWYNSGKEEQISHNFKIKQVPITERRWPAVTSHNMMVLAVETSGTDHRRRGSVSAVPKREKSSRLPAGNSNQKSDNTRQFKKTCRTRGSKKMPTIIISLLLFWQVLGFDNTPDWKENSHHLSAHDCQIPVSLRRYVLSADCMMTSRNNPRSLASDLIPI